ncbi:hypothetical protein MM300_02080 [Evansella sp. LMS18]|jgi:hypothetical protein|uniref:hypothetical protein n=1 Tax=Evansella sp. LMS18 TaxID=2924033 RepID=UPI0020D0D17F|nr:hypothetical protein [Evansella sp. LMS18]UTR11142.1 hypothetical protein MM300_02080 [Evansella sp. LMS18]
MGKKTCWGIIFVTIAINVVMLQWTVEAWLGREYEITLVYSGVAVVSAFIAFFTLLQWRKLEYKTGTEKKPDASGQSGETDQAV